MFPLAFVAGWLQGPWWGFISRNYVVWSTFFLMNVFIALKGSHFWFYFILYQNTRYTSAYLFGQCRQPCMLSGDSASDKITPASRKEFEGHVDIKWLSGYGIWYRRASGRYISGVNMNWFCVLYIRQSRWKGNDQEPRDWIPHPALDTKWDFYWKLPIFRVSNVCPFARTV